LLFEELTVNPPSGPARPWPSTGQDSCRRPAKVIVVNQYGGILFSAGVQFCGVFAYKEHVSVEFGSGAKIKDDLGHLEGSGKGRRHLKFSSLADIKSKMLAQYVLLAHNAASGA
jgi:hypothetical protein